MYKLVKTFFLIAIFLGSLATNVLTLTSTAFNALLSGGLATYTGMQTVSQRLVAMQTAKKTAVRSFGRSFISRTGRIAVATISSLPLKVVPALGLAALLVGTAYELSQLCIGLQDVELLYSEMEIEDDAPEDIYQQVCHPTLPDFLKPDPL